MAKKFIILIICVFTTLSVLQAQKTKAVIYFKNGDTIAGLGKIKGNSVKYRKNRKEKSSKLHFSKLERVKIYYTDEITSYVYLKVKNQDTPKVFEEVTVGNISLYRTVSQSYNPGFGGGFGAMGGTGFSGGYSYTIKNFYVKRREQDFVIHLGSNQLFTKNFKKAASEYFKDCPKLVKLIQNREFKKRDLIEIVEFYNQQCN